jgi:hypothetical protein
VIAFDLPGLAVGVLALMFGLGIVIAVSSRSVSRLATRALPSEGGA